MIPFSILLGCAAGLEGAQIQVKTHEVDPRILAERRAHKEERPALRGFRASMLEAAHTAWPSELPGDPKLAAAAEIVSKRLARDGLPLTLAAAIEAIGPDRFAAGDEFETLKQVGVPVDWLACFESPSPPSLVRWIARKLRDGEKPAGIKELSSLAFAFRPTLPGFQVATESGEHGIGAVRMQIGSGTYYAGEGDGGVVDVVRQLALLLPDSPIVASVEEKNLAPFRALAGGWKFQRSEPLTLIVEPMPMAQWAQDDGKPGIVDLNGTRTVVTLVPRYASRGEVGAMFFAGETNALEGFASAGYRVVQSPLLFQGGDLLPVRDPRTGMREMIVGEAELWRNTALGLTRAQVLEAFRVEFGVERCIVLPAVSFHVDYEISVRATETELLAFVDDTSAAARLVIGCGIGALERGGELSAQNAAAAREHIAANRMEPLLQLVTDALVPRMKGPGFYPESFANKFALGASDSGVGNLQRFLLAVDTLTAETLGETKAEDLDMDPHAAAYLISMGRREKERHMVADALAREGFHVIAVPSTSEGDRSLNTLNGVHVRGAYYMPAYGGLFADFDRAAQKAFEKAFEKASAKDVKVVPVLCGESERRDGALHCAVSILPRL